MIKEYTGRTIRLIFGLVLYGLGSYMSIQANVGLAPWDAFSMGISYKTGIMYGNVVVYTGFLIIIIDFLLKEKIGFGTIINAILIGKVVDLCNYLGLLPMLDNFAAGVAMLFAGQVFLHWSRHGLRPQRCPYGRNGQEVFKTSHRSCQRHT